MQAALTEPWSTGPVEGHINRLKLIKRQMFGRAKLDLLHRRVVNAAYVALLLPRNCTKSAEEPYSDCKPATVPT